MKKILLPVVFLLLSGTVVSGQAVSDDCRKLMEDLEKKLNDKIDLIAKSTTIENNHVFGIGEWILSLKEHVTKNSFGLFSGMGSSERGCNDDIADIFRNFFRSNYSYFFQTSSYAGISTCLGNSAPDLNSPPERLKQIAFTLRALFPLSSSKTLMEAGKESYSAFYNYLYNEIDPTNPDIAKFFYDHTDDIQKATGFVPNPGDQDREIYAKEFILSFRPHLQYYFGVAEEEYIKAHANNKLSQMRTVGEPEHYFRKILRDDLVTGLRLIAAELSKLKDICGEISTDPTNGLIKRISTSTPPLTPSQFPEKPKGDAGNLQPGHGWVVISILNANGKIYRDNGGLPKLSLAVNENGNKKWYGYIYSSSYVQVLAGTYSVSFWSSYPPVEITVNAGEETKVVLRLGRLILDTRNFDGTAWQQDISLYALLDKNETSGGKLTSQFAGYYKGGDTVDLAPGQYTVNNSYGTIKQAVPITIHSMECTKLTISGIAKFTGIKEGIRISRIIPNVAQPELVAVRNISYGLDIQLPPGLYEIERPDILYKYRLKMEPGSSYTYKRP